jgi:hypothetical protein
MWADIMGIGIAMFCGQISWGFMVGEQMISACEVPMVMHGGGGVMLWGCFAGDTVYDLFRIQGTLNQHGYHSILQ